MSDKIMRSWQQQLHETRERLESFCQAEHRLFHAEIHIPNEVAQSQVADGLLAEASQWVVGDQAQLSLAMTFPLVRDGMSYRWSLLYGDKGGLEDLGGLARSIVPHANSFRGLLALPTLPEAPLDGTGQHVWPVIVGIIGQRAEDERINLTPSPDLVPKGHAMADSVALLMPRTNIFEASRIAIDVLLDAPKNLFAQDRQGLERFTQAHPYEYPADANPPSPIWALCERARGVMGLLKYFAGTYEPKSGARWHIRNALYPRYTHDITRTAISLAITQATSNGLASLTERLEAIYNAEQAFANAWVHRGNALTALPEWMTLNGALVQVSPYLGSFGSTPAEGTQAGKSGASKKSRQVSKEIEMLGKNAVLEKLIEAEEVDRTGRSLDSMLKEVGVTRTVFGGSSRLQPAHDAWGSLESARQSARDYHKPEGDYAADGGLDSDGDYISPG